MKEELDLDYRKGVKLTLVPKEEEDFHYGRVKLTLF